MERARGGGGDSQPTEYVKKRKVVFTRLDFLRLLCCCIAKQAYWKTSGLKGKEEEIICFKSQKLLLYDFC